MAINAVSFMSPTQSVNEINTINKQVTSADAQETFANALKDAISNVNAQQMQSDTMTQKLINGGDVDLHEVMIASQKASVTLGATIEIRNKAVEAYQEIMRMSV
ncbi:flagellar hook-basal body complex protein FliE [Solibacillus sp. R5-41]|uniref:flagellar hook-basal body complex protein FliE n=1 Tax=Solibacillus sp. R5-41 TaxID=2048654 RepID=UPI000C126816|nr:flagellar hook-basal body complex protein FliE [Solibacillus sp. R5-41]ATP39348.1 flagellar hook-basal body complex protein FliE [Solibacillus sp. R5-41]